MSELSQGGKLAAGMLLGWPLAALMSLYMVWAEGYVGAQIWNWHLTPLGLPELTWKPAAGAALLLFLALNRAPRPQPEDARETWEKVFALLGYFIAPWLALLVGWWLT